MARTSARGLSLRLACMQGLCVIRRVIDHLTEKVERRLTDLSHLNDRYWSILLKNSVFKTVVFSFAIYCQFRIIDMRR